MYLSIPDWWDGDHGEAVIAAFVRRIKREIARGENLRGWTGYETVHGCLYKAVVDLDVPYADITEL